MKSFDEMKDMTEAELEAYRAREVESIIAQAEPMRQLALRAQHARLMAELKRVKNPLVRADIASRHMMLHFAELNEKLQELVGEDDE